MLDQILLVRYIVLLCKILKNKYFVLLGEKEGLCAEEVADADAHVRPDIIAEELLVKLHAEDHHEDGDKESEEGFALGEGQPVIWDGGAEHLPDDYR